jgi:acetolactate synthase-1/2/3 large subunit
MIGADIIAKTLKDEFVRYIFEYPGGCTVYMLDAIKKQGINIVTCRDERAASFAACGYARSTGEIGVCMATSGPGATNLITGIANAYFDYIPILAITGQVPSNQYQKSYTRQSGFQEIDIVKICRPIIVDYRQPKEISQDDLSRLIRSAYKFGGPVLYDVHLDLQRNEVNI